MHRFRLMKFYVVGVAAVVAVAVWGVSMRRAVTDSETQQAAEDETEAPSAPSVTLCGFPGNRRGGRAASTTAPSSGPPPAARQQPWHGRPPRGPCYSPRPSFSLSGNKAPTASVWTGEAKTAVTVVVK
jgi:hypothetical protein